MEVVEHRRSSGRKDADDGIHVVLGVVCVDEEQVEGRLGRKQVSPGSSADRHVRVVREQMRSDRGQPGVELGGEEGRLRRQGGDDPRGSDADAGSDLSRPANTTTGREHV